MSNAMSVLAGILFGVGLGIAGMLDPANIRGFLDILGAWNPTLLLVMGGGIATHMVLYRLIRRRPSPLFEAAFALPTKQDIDTPLVVGAAVFGVGWGLGGYCPGPGIVAMASGGLAPVIFVASMVGGMLIQHYKPAPRATLQT